MRFADSSTAPTKRTVRCWHKRGLRSARELDVARGEAESQLARAADRLAEREDELDSLETDNRLVAARLVEEIQRSPICIASSTDSWRPSRRSAVGSAMQAQRSSRRTARLR